MRRVPSIPERIGEFDGLWSLRKGDLSCYVMELQDGSICLYSPVTKTSMAVSSMGPVRFLFAPNHYHNKAISEFSQTYSDAKLVCSDFAKPRLEKVTSRQFDGLEELASALPEAVTLVEPEGLKTGEVWLSIKCGANIAWVVTDAFCGHDGKETGNTELGFLKTFPKYGVQDAGRFTDWVRSRLEDEIPTHVFPCHGSAVQGPELKSDMLALLDQL